MNQYLLKQELQQYNISSKFILELSKDKIVSVIEKKISSLLIYKYITYSFFFFIKKHNMSNKDLGIWSTNRFMLFFF